MVAGGVRIYACDDAEIVDTHALGLNTPSQIKRCDRSLGERTNPCYAGSPVIVPGIWNVMNLLVEALCAKAGAVHKANNVAAAKGCRSNTEQKFVISN